MEKIKLGKAGNQFEVTDSYGTKQKQSWQFIHNGELKEGTVTCCKTNALWREGDTVEVAEIRPWTDKNGKLKYNIILPKPIFNNHAPLTSETINETSILVNIGNLESKIDKLNYLLLDIAQKLGVETSKTRKDDIPF